MLQIALRPLNPDPAHRSSRERAKEYPPQGITQGDTEATLQWFSRKAPIVIRTFNILHLRQYQRQQTFFALQCHRE